MSDECQKDTFRKNLRADLEKLDLPPLGLSVLKEAAFSDPKRRVAHGRSNVTIRFVSRKMGCTIQCESHIELGAVWEMEFGRTAYFWDQAVKLQVKYSEPGGRRRSLDTVVDFIRIEDGKVIVVDCKPLKELERISGNCPDRYERNADGVWTSPAGERAAAQFGFEYRVFSEKNINVVWSRNYTYLADYLHHSIEGEMETRVDKVVDYVKSKKILRLSALHEAVQDRDAVFFSIAHSRVFVDLDVYLVERPTVAEVCEDRALASIVRALDFTPPELDPNPVSIEAGTTVLWNGVPYNVQCAGPDGYSLQGPHDMPTVLSRKAAAEYVRRGVLKATGVSTACSDVAVHILKTTKQELLDVAEKRQRALEHSASGEPLKEPKSDRTLGRWRARYLQAQRTCGYGILGLIPKYDCQGRRGSRLLEDQERICAEVIEQEYLTPTCKSYRATYACLVDRLEEEGIPQIDYTTLIRRIQKLDRRMVVTKRNGRGPAYQLGPKWREELAQPEARIPRQGSRAWEAAYVDHTQLDEELNSEIDGGPLGKPYITALLDRFSGKPLAHVISYDPPNAMTVMLLVRECVRVWGRLPDFIIVDGAGEFHSDLVEQSLSMLGIHIIERPPHEPRHGSGIERAFRTIFTSLVYNMAGNTQNSKPGDRTRPRHDPSKHALWTPREFNERLTHFLYTVWPDQPNSGTKESAQQRYERSVAEQGPRNHRYIPYDRALYLITLPYAPKVSRKVRQGHVKVVNATYTSEELRGLAHEGEDVHVRYDPRDRRVAYALLANEWVELEVVDSEVLNLLEHNLPFLDLELAARARASGRRYRLVPESYRRMLKDIRRHEQTPTIQIPVDRDGDDPSSFDDRPDAPTPAPYGPPPVRPSFPNELNLETELPEDLCS